MKEILAYSSLILGAYLVGSAFDFLFDYFGRKEILKKKNEKTN